MIDAATLVITGARAITLAGPPGLRRGGDMSALGIRACADIFIAGDRVVGVEPADAIAVPRSARVVEAGGRVVMPGFIDCHTHACFAGSRIDEWELKLRGVPYLDILRAGGGIMSTVRATRECPAAELARLTRNRLEAMLAAGSTTIEVKSGYGLSAEGELHMLRTIVAAASGPGRAVPDVVLTALLGHAIEGEHKEFVGATVERTLSAVSSEFPGIPVDAFCEVGSWAVEDVIALFRAAALRGHPLRLHADQFNSLGGLGAAVELNARTVDHLEASSDQDLCRLAHSGTIAVGLPICGFHLDGRYAKLRTVIDAGGAVAIASNFNPGSAPSWSIPFAMALAARHCGLSPAEAICGVTVNAAAALGLGDRGRIESGLRADLVVLNETDERSLVYAFANDSVAHVVAAGRLIR